MSEHTPGPWRRGVGEINYGAVVADTAPSRHREIQEIYDAREVEAYGGYVIAESIAPQNISIICAAPDLLAACELALDTYDPCSSVSAASACEALVAAIAKAKGRR